MLLMPSTCYTRQSTCYTTQSTSYWASCQPLWKKIHVKAYASHVLQTENFDSTCVHIKMVCEADTDDFIWQKKKLKPTLMTLLFLSLKLVQQLFTDHVHIKILVKPQWGVCDPNHHFSTLARKTEFHLQAPSVIAVWRQLYLHISCLQNC